MRSVIAMIYVLMAQVKCFLLGISLNELDDMDISIEEHFNLYISKKIHLLKI